MADILIKNMEMPTECLECPLKDCENAWDFGYTRPDDCPLMEIPPHGRLIDADELEASDAILVGKEAWDMVHEAPTILEASYGF